MATLLSTWQSPNVLGSLAAPTSPSLVGGVGGGGRGGGPENRSGPITWHSGGVGGVRVNRISKNVEH